MTPTDEVRAFAATRDAVLVTNDAARIAASMTDDWIYVGADGVTSKTEIIGSIASGRLAHHSMTVVGGERVVQAGGTVIVTARRASSGTWDGVPYTADQWMTEVYVRDEDGDWCCAFSQTTDASG